MNKDSSVPNNLQDEECAGPKSNQDQAIAKLIEEVDLCQKIEKLLSEPQ